VGQIATPGTKIRAPIILVQRKHICFAYSLLTELALQLLSTVRDDSKLKTKIMASAMAQGQYLLIGTIFDP
jgi:hypothetical protein